MKKLTIYIAGKISSEPVHTCTMKFGTVQKEIERLGHRAINPLEVNLGVDKSWHDAMRNDIKALIDCDAIFLLKDYRNSRGALLEAQIARAMDMPVFDNLKDLKRHTKSRIIS